MHFLSVIIVPKSCIICRTVASPDLQLLYSAQCQSSLYCSKACQRKDWKEQRKEICKLLNVGHGDMQVRTDMHESRLVVLKEVSESNKRDLTEDMKRFFKLFEESTFEGSRAVALKMRKIAKRQTKHNQKFLLCHVFHVLVLSDLKMLSWPNSPLLVMLQFIDPNVVFSQETSSTPLHHLADLADPSDYSTHEKQLILAKQLIEHGANVNAVSISRGETPLHGACNFASVTNLDYVELLCGAL
jgi:hypothetical protein